MISIMVAAAGREPDIVALEQVVHDELGRDLRGDAGAAAGHGDDQVVEPRHRTESSTTTVTIIGPSSGSTIER